MLGRLTISAEAVEFEFVSFNGKPIFSSDGFLQVFNLTVVKFHNFSAACANQMVMMAFVRHIVELRLGAEMALLCQAGVTKEFERSVDGREANMWVFFG